jgi:spermidine synthase
MPSSLMELTQSDLRCHFLSPHSFRHADKPLSDMASCRFNAARLFYFRDEVKMVWRNLKQVFEQVKLYLGFVPTYPSGLWAYAMAGNHLPNLDAAELRRRCQQRGLTNFRYYSPEVHIASFALPPFVQELLQ